jgi:DNA processing protein
MMIQQKSLSDFERAQWWQLSRTDRVGPITFFRLIERYGTAARALEALPELSRRGGQRTPLRAMPNAARDDEIAAIHKTGARLIAACEPEYPELLRQIDDAPPVIVVRGHAHLMTRPCIGMVGARNASLPGRKMAMTLARDMGASGYTVVSGLARGIDTAAHEASLQTGTVAVVAGGIDVVYPPENKKLYDQMVDVGCIITEHPAGLEPKAPYFPRRNRMIAGMSRGVVVVEATVNSGSLITARCAAEQGRDVFAVPGSPLDPRAGGPNMLIRDGATLVERADHILGALTLYKSAPVLADLGFSTYDAAAGEVDAKLAEQLRGAILENLTYTSITVDELARACHVSVHLVQSAVLELELAGQVERRPGGHIVLMDKDFLSADPVAGHR